MGKLIVDGKVFNERPFSSENEVEEFVERFSSQVFGPESFYFNLKRKSGSGSRVISVPDGYLLDFARTKPQLVIVENELSSHDAFKHIGIQVLKYASTFREGTAHLKSLLNKHIHSDPKVASRVEAQAKRAGFKNVSELLDFVIYENTFRFMVVIDEATEDVNFVLRQLANAPDIVEIKRYARGEQIIYRIDGLREEIVRQLPKSVRSIDDLDTIVCAARAKGFKDTFLVENRWYAIRLSPSMIGQLKFLAMYEIRPVSAIRWIGFIREIRPYGNTGKYEVILSEKKQIKPITLGTGKGIAPQAPRYTTKKLLDSAKTVADLW